LATPSGREHLIIQTAFLGDLLLGIPLFKELRRLRPDDRLTLLCRQGLGDLILRLGLVDEVMEVDKSSSASWREAARRLRAREFEWLICPHESPRSLLLVARLRAKRKIGYRNGVLGWVFNARLERPMPFPEPVRQLALLSGLPSEDAAAWRVRLREYGSLQSQAGGQRADGGLAPVPEWASMTVDRLARLRDNKNDLSVKAREIHASLGVGSGQRAVFLAPGSVWKTKMWAFDGYLGAARALLKAGHKVVITGAPDEKPLVDAIAARAPGAASIAGRASLFESAELLATADLLICNDSGAMHLAAISGVPTVAVFGPTVLDFGYRPWQDSARVVQVPRSELKCRPCGKHGAAACPIGTHECMTRVSVESVLRSAADFISV